MVEGSLAGAPAVAAARARVHRVIYWEVAERELRAREAERDAEVRYAAGSITEYPYLEDELGDATTAWKEAALAARGLDADLADSDDDPALRAAAIAAARAESYDELTRAAATLAHNSSYARARDALARAEAWLL